VFSVQGVVESSRSDFWENDRHGQCKNKKYKNLLENALLLCMSEIRLRHWKGKMMQLQLRLLFFASVAQKMMHTVHCILYLPCGFDRYVAGSSSVCSKRMQIRSPAPAPQHCFSAFCNINHPLFSGTPSLIFYSITYNCLFNLLFLQLKLYGTYNSCFSATCRAKIIFCTLHSLPNMCSHIN
jgi:hypothetical protein